MGVDGCGSEVEGWGGGSYVYVMGCGAVVGGFFLWVGCFFGFVWVHGWMRYAFLCFYGYYIFMVCGGGWWGIGDGGGQNGTDDRMSL